MTTSPTPAAPTALLSAEVVRLVRASHGMKAQIHAAHGDGLEWAGSMLLFHLCKDGPQRSSALAAAVCVDPSTVSRQIADLVELGLVERRADPQDGRATLLAATEAGQARHRLRPRAPRPRLRRLAGRLVGGRRPHARRPVAPLQRHHRSHSSSPSAVDAIDQPAAAARRLETA